LRREAALQSEQIGQIPGIEKRLSMPVEFSPEVAGENSPLRSAFSLTAEQEDDFVCGGTEAVA
jgi:hypothetical protein